MKENGRHGYLLPAVTAAAALAAVGLFALFALPCADDFMYASFLDGGLSGFIRSMADHYRTYNGRVLVHTAAALILRLGFWSFAIVCPVVCGAIPALSALSEGRGRGYAVTATALFAAGFLSLPYKVLSWGVYWVAAFCNYALPTAMLCGLVYLELRAPEGKGRSAAAPVLAFLCGATTEQSGLLAVLLTLWFALRALKLRRGRVSALLSALLAAAGLYTVFLSPATRLRAANEAGVTSLPGLLRGLPAGLWRVAVELRGDGWFAPVMLALLFLLTAVLLKKRRLPALLAAAAAVLTAAAGFWGSWPLWAAVFLLAALDAAALIAAGRDVPGVLVLSGLASVAVMVPTTSVAGRTLIPFYLFMLSAVSCLAAGELEDRPALRAAAPALLLGLSLFTVIPMAGGFARNQQVERINERNVAAARETGVLNYRVDYDYRCTWTKINASFSPDFLRLHGLPADTVIRWYAEDRPQVYVDGQKQYPALVWDGETLLTIRLLEALGGTIEPRQDYSHLTKTLPWRTVYMDSAWDGTTLFTVSGGGTSTVRAVSLENRTWFAPQVYEEVFGLEITYDEGLPGWVAAAP